MEKVLSQEEVDSLLNGIDEGKVETETNIPESADDFDVYDFKSNSKSYHLRMPALGIITERFTSFINTDLSSATGSIIDVSVKEIDSIAYGKLCRSLPLPASLNIFKMTPLRGYALLILEGPLVFSFVDIFFGGKCSTHVKLEGRSFTAIETKLIERIVEIVLQDFEKAWLDIYEVETEYTRMEIDPQFAGIAKPEDMIIAIKFNVDIGNFSGNMTIGIPYNTLEAIIEKLSQSYKDENIEVDSLWRERIINRLMDVEVNLTCTLGENTITGRELLEMKEGDVILLDKCVTDPVNISIEGQEKLKGYAGSINDKKAIRIEKWENGVSYEHE